MTDISESQGTEHSVHYGMSQHISIRVTEKTDGMRYFYTAENELSTFHEPVNIIAVTNSEHKKSPPVSDRSRDEYISAENEIIRVSLYIS